ncbi:hypothetical protein HPB47_000970 [Ixodes persulcatus]|uniref:Uncharacterized protein n=1 Tax=Ixodes persulcatus TaxID=34615 RepID=A0AC60PQC7_IXOPE|nr:hypothetical protein HPB47_000970 [Ixodes persulcatus]
MPTGSTAGTRAADKQLYKDILAQQQENVKLERQCLLAKLKALEEEARAARAAYEAAEERDHLRQQPAVEGRPAPLDRRRHRPPRLRPVWRPSTTPTGSTAGTRAVDKQFYKDILAQQQENVKLERQCLLAKLKTSEEEARAARAACEAAEESAIWASYFHSCSTNTAFNYKHCPEGAMSWCKHKQAEAPRGPRPNDAPILAKAQGTALLPIYERLTDEKLLTRCIQGKTQNAAGSVNSEIMLP